jgi:L-arabinokinase
MTTVVLPKSKWELEFNQGSEYGSEEREAVLRVFEANAPSCGSEVLAFEKEFAEYNGNQYAIAVGNCTQGLEIAVRAALALVARIDGNKDRNEVIVPAVSWISTASSAALAGAVVKFADVVDPTVCIDMNEVKKLVTPRTAVVVVVHLYGRSVEGLVEAISWLRERSIMVIEDCAHAAGSIDSSGLRCGTIGDVGVFSFHQQKNMVTLGEGGCCVTNNADLRELMVGYRSLCAKSYDPKGKYLSIDSTVHPMGKLYWMMDFADHGHNFRMTDIQAAVGRAQLKKLDRWNARRREIAQALHVGLQGIEGLVLPTVETEGKLVHSWHLFHVLVTPSFPLPKEEFLWALLQDFGIKAWNHYMPMHLATSFRSRGLGQVGDCPVAESLFEQYVSLPIHPRLTETAVNYMIGAIKQLASRSPLPRSSATPLLSALLALTTPKSPNSAGNSSESATIATTETLIASQWALFEPQVQAAVRDGLLAASSGHIPVPVTLTRAPGRLDLMGGNDDYTGGLVFECTIAEATYVAAQPRSMDDASLVIRNRQLHDTDVVVPLSILHSACKAVDPPAFLSKQLKELFPETRWPLYVVGVLLWLTMRYPQQMFAHNQGLAMLIWTQVPLNRGVSSSASVEVAVMKAAAKAFGIDLCGELLATACQWAENQVCNSACGLMDQMAVTLGAPFMAMRCQPAIILSAPPLPSELTVYALDSGVSHEVSGVEYEAARAAAFMGYKIICTMQGLAIVADTLGEIPRFTDAKYNGYLANLSPSEFAREYEARLPETMLGQEFLEQYGAHVDPATPVLPQHIYHIRANTRYAVKENNRVTVFSQLLRGCIGSEEERKDIYAQLGELMYQSHDSYTECGLGSTATSLIVDLVRGLGPSSGLFGAKITGGGAGGTVAILGLHSAKGVFERQVVAEYAKKCGLVESPYVFVGSSIGADAFGTKELRFP